MAIQIRVFCKLEIRILYLQCVRKKVFITISFFSGNVFRLEVLKLICEKCFSIQIRFARIYLLFCIWIMKSFVQKLLRKQVFCHLLQVQCFFVVNFNALEKKKHFTESLHESFCFLKFELKNKDKILYVLYIDVWDNCDSVWKIFKIKSYFKPSMEGNVFQICNI